MADTIRCPMCGKPNPTDLDVCQFCGARLKPLVAPSPDSSHSIKAGEQPVHKGTAEFEKVKPADQGSIRPGEAPTKKNTADLERALPSWLRSLRGDDADTGSGLESAAAFTEDASSLPPAETPIFKDSGQSSDWLAGLNKASAEEEEAVPDWLAGLRGEEKPADSGAEQPFEGGMGSELGSADWMARLDTPAAPAPTETSFPEAAPTEFPAPSSESEPSPAWLKSQEPSEPVPPQPTPAPTEDRPAWLDQFEAQAAASEVAASARAPAEPARGEEIPDWLDQLQGKAAGSEPTFQTGDTAVPAPGNELPGWLNSPSEKGPAPEEIASAGSAVVPDWLSNLQPPTDVPIAASNEAVPDWLSNLEAKPGLEPQSGPALIPEEPEAEIPSAAELPSWLTQLPSEAQPEGAVDKSQMIFESGPVPSEAAPEPLPEWLAGIEPSAPPVGETPAFIGPEKPVSPDTAGPVEKMLGMETPEWLSQVKPEQAQDKTTPEGAAAEGQGSAGGLEAAALPSWVQAMRPVESVVDRSKMPALEENQVTEHSGPLAGLTGVLPSGPGLGMSRKPPAYSVKLQVSTAQQKYISSLEQLVAAETRPSAVQEERLHPNRIWRWAISALLILMISVPFIFPKMRMTPAATLLPSDRGATKALLEGLPANAPVLIAFDYEPALSGELEMTAAPLVDQLESKGARLTFVSTSPTGSVLAQRFFSSALLVNSHQYKNREQYVNLGYIAGGPAGISLFASHPSAAMPVDADGYAAWDKPPLQGVSRLGDFAAVIILTGDADTGRNWVEQAGPYLGKASMVMVISAQAQPMVQPYFDSGQLQGLVSGLADAKTHEQTYNRPGLANHYWDSFSLGALIAELIIAVGAIWSALVTWRLRPSKPKGRD